MTIKDTKDKPKLSYIPYDSMVKMAEVRQFGVDKYGDDVCWKQVDQRDFLDAALRHIYKHLDGKDIDPESGLTHIAHAATSLVLALGLNALRRQYTTEEVLDMLDQLEYSEVEPFSHDQVWEDAFGILKDSTHSDFCGESDQADLQSCYDEVGKKPIDEYELAYDDSIYHPTHYPRRNS